MDKKNQQQNRIQVLLPLPLRQAFDYAIPAGQDIPPVGSFVRVPFGPRKMTGIVWSVGKNDSLCPDSKIKAIDSVYPFLPLTNENLELIDWVASYTLSSPGSVMKMAMSVDDVFEGVGEQWGYVVNPDCPSGIKWTDARKKVYEVAGQVPFLMSELARKAGVSDGVVRGLVDQGALIEKKIEPTLFEIPNPDYETVSLSAEQNNAAKFLSDKIGNGFNVTVLNGITGSGKTEVYFEAVAKALKQGKQVLVMLPEIGLTGQWLERFKKRFGVLPAQWHSDVTNRIKRETWKAVLNQKIQVVAGARSALFLPYSNLGLIIVDEEHDSSYKQEDGVLYQARDMAVVRAKISNIPIILSSATPSLETLANVDQKKYDEVCLKNRYGIAVLPEKKLINMRLNPPEPPAENLQGFLSPVLVNAISENLQKNEQSLLFLNRRGYAPLVLCRKCGNRFACPHCSAWLVEHVTKNGRSLLCHHCGYQIQKPKTCPVCGEENCFAACGPGVERIAEEVKIRFPTARTLVVSTDLDVTATKMNELMKQIHDNEIDIVIGTQILTKGHNFPNLTLVGIIDADLGLNGGDLRAGERTYQMLEQVAGRAGRAEKKGCVYLQSYEPDNLIIQALIQGNRDKFIELEKEVRKSTKYPPFGRLAALVVSGEKNERVEKVACALGQSAPQGNGVRVLGPAPALFSLLRGRYRYRLLMQTTKNIKIQDAVQQWISKVEIPKDVDVRIDIDPYSFF